MCYATFDNGRAGKGRILHWIARLIGLLLQLPFPFILRLLLFSSNFGVRSGPRKSGEQAIVTPTPIFPATGICLASHFDSSMARFIMRTLSSSTCKSSANCCLNDKERSQDRAESEVTAPPTVHRSSAHRHFLRERLCSQADTLPRLVMQSPLEGAGKKKDPQVKSRARG